MDGLIWIIILLLLTLINTAAIQLHKRNKLHFFWSGIGIGILGPILAFSIGAVFVKIDHSQGGTGEGGAITAAFIGLIIIGNGVIYLIIGLISKIVSWVRG
ncbi:ABC transporter permease [Neobacillus jeddahensis]|uniref:ABC transporter permease n=1 Tax=Neobacillus jeddahensis TaxID=1461580 RepID=UPI000A964FE3|nr:ABC transporter permease [Neobacillus jeddahensis]